MLGTGPFKSVLTAKNIHFERERARTTYVGGVEICICDSDSDSHSDKACLSVYAAAMQLCNAKVISWD
jgi:hypothetical protein